MTPQVYPKLLYLTEHLNYFFLPSTVLSLGVISTFFPRSTPLIWNTSMKYSIPVRAFL